MKKFINEIKPYVLIVVVVVLFRNFIATPAIVNGDSMIPILKDHDIVIVNKLILKTNDIERFDVVVINNDEDGDRIIKRVIGLPNEKIEYKDNKLYINGKLKSYNIDFEDTDDFSTETGKDEYFVLGDNRNISKDSRILGNFNTKDIIGIVHFRLYPFDKIGFIK